MKVLVTGVTGQLGFDVMRELEAEGIPAKGCGRKDFSLTDHAAARACIEDYAPDVVVHCAAYTAVDKAEDEAELAQAVNADAVRNIAGVCLDIGAKLIYISTDYVFPGDGEAFYEPDAPKGPTNAYGRSKLAGEEAVQELLEKYFIVRISWVFGIHGKRRDPALPRGQDAEAQRDTQGTHGGCRSGGFSHLYPGFGPPPRRYGKERKVWSLSRDE